MGIICGIVIGAVGGIALVTTIFLFRRHKTVVAHATRHASMLSEAMEYAHASIDMAPHGFIIASEDKTIVHVNDAFCRMTGRSREDFVGRRPPYPGWAPEEYEMLRERWERAARGDVEPIETIYVKENGERFPAQYIPGITRTPDGKLYVFATVKDLSEQKRLEESLRESEEMFRRIVETSTDVIYQLDLDGKVTYVSPGVEAILGIAPEEMIGTYFRDHFRPEDLTPVEEARDQNLRGEAVRHREFRILNKNGEPVDIEISATTIRKDGRIVGTQGVARDIRERKRVEAELRASETKVRSQFKGLPVPVYAYQKKGNDIILVDCNDAAVTMTRGKIGAWFGCKATDFHAGRPDIVGYLEKCFEEKGSHSVETKYQLRTTGETKYLSVTVGYVEPDMVLVHTEDITARKEVEERLVASEARLRTVFESVPFHLFLIDVDGRYVMQNAATLKEWGNIVGKRPEDVATDEEALSLWLDNNRRALAGEVVSGEVSFSVKGEPHYFHNIVSPVRGGDGIVGAMVVNVDITERKLAEKELKESEEKYRFLVENTGTAVSFWDTEGKILIVNRIAAGLWGKTAEEMVGKTAHDFLPKEQADKVRGRQEKVLRTGAGMQSEEHLNTATGERWFRSYLQPVKDAEGRLVGVQIVSHDVTELMRAERALRESDARLRLMVSQVPAVLWTVDRDLRFTSSSGAGLDRLGARAGRVVGMTMQEYLKTDDRGSFLIARCQGALQGDAASFEMTWKDLVFQNHIEPLHDDKGDIIGCVGLAIDITDRKLVEEEVKRSREQLRALAGRLQDAREEEGAVIAREVHDELGQALTGLKFDLDYVKRRLGRCHEAEERAQLEKKIKEMYATIDAEIFLVRRISTHLRTKVLDDLGLVGAIESFAQEFQQRTGIMCDVNQYDAQVLEASLDLPRKTAVFRILQESLTNVRRHAEATRVWVDLRGEDGFFILEVRDNGKGIPPEKLRDGLGVLGMRERAQVFGGRVKIASEPGKGTSVSVTIPLGEAP